MKKFILALATLFTVTVSASAMSYEQARNEALFLTDKMAYELNLTEDQYEAAYEINLDYLMNVNTVDDLYGSYWRYRNLDMSYILLDWQYRAFCDAVYFYRPIYWGGGYWHFGIYARYPVRDYFYFGHPHFYAVYRGGHSWRMNGGRSWYHGRRDWGRPDHGPAVGMRDGFRRGDYRNGFDNNRNRTFGNMNNRNGNGSRTFGNGKRNNGSFGGQRPGNSSFGNGTNNNRPAKTTTSGNRSFGTTRSSSNSGVSTSTQKQNNNRSFGGSRNYNTQPRSSTRTTVTRTTTPTSRNFGTQSRTMNRSSFERSSSFRTNATPSRNFGSSSRSVSTPSRSFGGGNAVSSPRSFGGSSRATSGGGSHGSFGGHR